MERRWVLVRHAPARSRDFARWPDDRGRPLKPSGRKEFAQAARGLAHLLQETGAAASSPLERARETGELLAERWPVARRLQSWNELVPDGRLSDLFARAQRSRTGGDLVLVGHEPELSRFVGYCLVGQGSSVVRLSKGGAIALDFPGRVRPGGGRLLWVLTRSQLRAVGKARGHEPPVEDAKEQEKDRETPRRAVRSTGRGRPE